ncbi:MAG TPA: hypothetical protein VHG51_01935 [Longimicrobiaceae bacterium]|nr:hypothetical protein [Longimicrobiaceae bacterium]
MHRWLSLLVLAATAACDPCAGVGTCVAPQVRYTGTVTTLFPDYPARGVPVEFVRTGGVSLDDPTLTAVSDSAGRFVLEGRAADEGTVVGRLVFHPPAPIAPVTIENVSMTTARAPGELRLLGTWMVQYPFFAYKGELFHRNNGRPPAKGMEVEFRRTGGIRIIPETFVVKSDSLGRFDLRPQTTTNGEVVGDLTVRLLPPYEPYVVRGLRLSTFTIPRLDSIIPVPIGYGLPYSAMLYWQRNREAAAGVRVEFRRTGGVPLYPDPYFTTTDSHGTVSLAAAPLASGEVVGDLIAHLPEPRGEAVVLRGLRLRTVEDSRPTEFIGFYGIPGGPDE